MYKTGGWVFLCLFVLHRAGLMVHSALRGWRRAGNTSLILQKTKLTIALCFSEQECNPCLFSNWLSFFYSVVSIKNSVSLEDTEITLNFIVLVIQIKVYDVWRHLYLLVTFLLLTENRHCTSASLSVFKSPWTESLIESWTVISLCMKKRHSFIYINVKLVYCTFFFILIECVCSSTQGMCLNRKD